MAWNRALAALVKLQERELNKPASAGQYWSRAEDKQICEELHKGMNFEEIAKTHNRPVPSIIVRPAAPAAVQLHGHALVQHPVVASGQPAIYTLDVVPAGGAFPNNATLAYSPIVTVEHMHHQPDTSKQRHQRRNPSHFHDHNDCAGYCGCASGARTEAADLHAVLIAAGLGCTLGRTATKSSEAICTFAVASAHGRRTLAGDCLQQRSSRQWQRKWTGEHAFWNVHDDSERHSEFASATDGAGAVDG
jgi:hypothetical protein